MIIRGGFSGKPLLLTLIIALAGFVSLCFSVGMNDEQWWYWSNKCLAEAYNTDGEHNLKKWELSLTNDNFIRLRKTFTNGKQEYYSFHIHRFKDLDYSGNTATGVLKLETIADDIIVQTYGDRAGNVDSMATTLSLQVKNMQPERLDSLRQALMQLKKNSP